VYSSKPLLKEVLQGDLYHLTIGIARFNVGQPDGTARFVRHLFDGELEHGLFAVVSHSCDITDTKVDARGKQVPWGKLPVVLGRVREAEIGLCRSVEAGPGWDRINEIDSGSFYDLFSYRDVPGHEGERLVLNLSDLITVQRKSIHPASKLVELADDDRLKLRVKTMLHFGRGDDVAKPLLDLTRVVATARASAPTPGTVGEGANAGTPPAAAG
jgi:hypothetical protein